MQYNNLLPRLCKIMNNLQDEESMIIYEARINYLFTRNEGEYYKVLGKLKKDSYCAELEDFLRDNDSCQGIVIYGAGEEGIRTKNLMDSCHRAAQFFCDDGDLVGKEIEGLKVISTGDLVKKYKRYIVVLSRQSCMADEYSLLLRSGFPRKQILFPMYWHLVACNGKQYFDVLSPVQNEIFVDAGAYNGDTIRDFLNWTGKNYKRIYAFEPNMDMVPIIRDFLSNERLEDVVFTPQATWSEQAELNFFKDASASRVGRGGRTKVRAIDIDSIVGDDKVTFIKMDVEGSELHSLIGACSTIRKNKPRLAISVYHHPEDIVEIAEYILELNPEYKFLLRQYNSNFWETILYAF